MFRRAIARQGQHASRQCRYCLPSSAPVARLYGTESKPAVPAAPSSEQVHPLGGYYEAILNEPQPIPDEKPEVPPQSSPKAPKKAPSNTPKAEAPARKSAAGSPTPSAAVPSPPPESAAAKAKVIFGSRLVGPAERAERLADTLARSTLVAGIMVPPRPDEPDNCCMSGCVNCVWDRYREEMEAWAAASSEAEVRLRSQGASESQLTPDQPVRRPSIAGAVPAPSAPAAMDEDGAGSRNEGWEAASVGARGPTGLSKDLWDEELYRALPVGIREFMKTEKRLKDRHMREGTSGG